MAARRRVSAAVTSILAEVTSKTEPEYPGTDAQLTEPPIRPAKFLTISKMFLAFSIPYFYLILSYYKIENDIKRLILINGFLSIFGFFVTLKMIPVASKYVLRRNLFGFDINKKGTPDGCIKVPESLGIVVGIVFLVVAIAFQQFYCTPDSIWLVEYNAALASICFMILLGFIDDVLDIPWRVKIALPAMAALPLLMSYGGHTTIIIPKPLVPYVGIQILDIGGVYKAYMFFLAIFCTNSINIHAGLNGLEVGQTIVIACAMLIHNVMQIGVSSDPEYQQAHAFSIYLVQPLLTTSLALFSFNWYPSSVFVGDTYTYFAGMTMAVAGILGHYSETLLIFFAPQVLNFLMSVPQLFCQLFKIKDCPRHRLPRFDPQSGLLTGTNDGTLVNFFLRQLGPKTEKSLCILLLTFQALCCGFCFLLRWFLAGWYK